MIANFIRKFFSGSQNYLDHSAKEDEHSKPAPGTSIYYDKELIKKLESDHVEMKKLFTKIVDDTEKGRTSSARAKILDFRAMLKKHIILEYIRLYVYLNHITEEDKTAHEIVADFRAEMAEIDKAVSGLAVASASMTVADLKKALDGVGNVLVDRINREETILYPIYMPV